MRGSRDFLELHSSLPAPHCHTRKRIRALCVPAFLPRQVANASGILAALTRFHAKRASFVSRPLAVFHLSACALDDLLMALEINECTESRHPRVEC
jgi:hypothetical protein